MNEAPAPAQFSAAYWENRATKLLGQLEATTEENARLRELLRGVAETFDGVDPVGPPLRDAIRAALVATDGHAP